jgi:hypothetical protein
MTLTPGTRAGSALVDVALAGPVLSDWAVAAQRARAPGPSANCHCGGGQARSTRWRVSGCAWGGRRRRSPRSRWRSSGAGSDSLLVALLALANGINKGSGSGLAARPETFGELFDQTPNESPIFLERRVWSQTSI